MALPKGYEIREEPSDLGDHALYRTGDDAYLGHIEGATVREREERARDLIALDKLLRSA